MGRRSGVGKIGLALVLSVTMVLSGCSTAWVGEAEQIVAVLIPAAANIVALVAALEGKGVSAADLQLIQSLITAYEKADPAAQPGILNQIQSAINTVQGNLRGLLPALHIKDTATQTKITAVVGILLSEVQSLAAVVPLVQAPTLAAKSAAGMGHPKAPLSASEFVKSYNATMTAKTGNAGLDRATAGFQIHLHGKVGRVVTAGILK